MASVLDMSKVYDRVKWNYLERVMKTMGFSDKWITLMMKCVESVSYFVLINGRACENIKPIRGPPILVFVLTLC